MGELGEAYGREKVTKGRDGSYGRVFRQFRYLGYINRKKNKKKLWKKKIKKK
jgi:hypothetical protein